MSERRVGNYLAKLQAVDEMGGTNAPGLSEHMGIGYETARTALRRLEAAGYVRSVRQKGKGTTATVTYLLTDQGQKAVADGVEIAVPTDGYVPVAQAGMLNEAALAWQDLHQALGMGCAIEPEAALLIDRGMDQEPEGWRLQA